MGGVVHGGKIWQASALSTKPVEEILDFSANINCQGPVPAVLEMFEDKALLKNLITHYPDEDYTNLKVAIASKFDVDVSRVTVGNGATELLALALKNQNRVLLPHPTYGEYQAVCENHQVTVSTFNFFDIYNHPHQLDELIESKEVSSVVLPLPNNPTAQLLPLESIKNWVQKFPLVHWIFDVSFIQFSPDYGVYWDFLKSVKAQVVMSLTKYYAIPGLRLGWMLGANDSTLEPWRVNAIAAEAGFLSLSDRGFDQRTSEWFMREKSYVHREWSKRLRLLVNEEDTHANFILVNLPESVDRMRLIAAFIERGILVRDAFSFGLKNTLRLAIKDREANKILLETYDRIIS